ncbi:MAG: 5-(carboxyamino)imidazole ribonucleotide mutase [Candidatus Hatepunaea meridiana]|nr:5-(carboxyamino)imidazole ribonucleotide mutase [Candidatus Hatepunaea meridiana]
MSEYKTLILIGSESDRKVMETALPYFDYFGIQADVKVSSAHRNPDKTAKLASNARKDGYQAIICGAGMAAHLAGVCAAHSDLPVIGVPLSGGAVDGLDALLSTVQMPSGIPVATFAIGKAGAINSAVFCARLFSLSDTEMQGKIAEFQAAGSKLRHA